jgi:hypothetical protein
MLQVAAEKPDSSRYLGMSSIAHSSLPNNVNDVFGNIENAYFATRAGLIGQDTVKPEVHEAMHKDLAASLSSKSADEPPSKVHDELNHDSVTWVLFDSKGNQYYFEVTDDEYSRSAKTVDGPTNIRYLETETREVISVKDYTEFVQPRAFSRLADEIYENAGSDHEFIYETWYVVTHATSYAREDVEQISFPLETLFLAKGDCEDLTILIASILTASSYTKDWEIKMVYFNAFNPGTSLTVNHVALYVDTGKESTFVESTTDSSGLNIWNKIEGWYLDV